MTELKTKRNDKSVNLYIESVESEERRQDATKLLAIFSAATGLRPSMWGDSIVGYGEYHYVSTRSSQEGDWPLTGFSVRKVSLTIYVTPGFSAFDAELSRLGKHKTSVGCLYINRLKDVDQGVLEEIIRKSVALTKQMYSTA